MQRADMERPPAHRRGYSWEWRQLRRRLLEESGIPREEWPHVQIDHEPRYNATLDPDHSHYRLTIRRAGEHSRKTALQTAEGIPASWKLEQTAPGFLFPRAVMDGGSTGPAQAFPWWDF